jgi:hypothetical protein
LPDNGLNSKLGPASVEQCVKPSTLSSGPWAEHSLRRRETAAAENSPAEAVCPVADFLACALVSLKKGRREFIFE